MITTTSFVGLSTQGFAFKASNYRIKRIRGRAGAVSASGFVQLHTSAVDISGNAGTPADGGLLPAPQNGVQSLFEVPYSANADFNKDIAVDGQAVLGPLMMALSSTAGTYTAVTDTHLTIYIDMESTEPELPTNLSSGGDWTTNRNSASNKFQIAGRKNLYRLQIAVYNSGGTDYLQVHPKLLAALTTGDIPTFKSIALNNNAYTDFHFGDGGLYLPITSTSIGLTLCLSSTEATYTASAADYFYFKASYK